jgi:hypothetical protein
VGALRRTWRRFRRRPPATQLGSLALVIVVIAGVVVAVVASSSGGSGSPSVGQAVSVSQASTSTRGVTATEINVVFPVANLDNLSNTEGFAGDPEDTEQVDAINLYVKEINDNGGINGRKIHPIIVSIDPTNDAEMRAQCKDWTEGTPAAFAVVDGLGTWSGDNQLCITQEGSTPFIGAWTTVTDWTRMGAPYLWWTGPDQASILAALVSWGESSGLLSPSIKVGVVSSSQPDDSLALNNYLLPDLRKVGITPLVETMDANPADSATTASQAPLIVQRLKAAGIQSLIPLIPFNAWFPELQAQTQQQFFPKLLLSDYASTITVGLGLIPVPYEKALDGQEGISTLTLGGIDDPRPESQGGYDPQVRSCYNTWLAAYPKTPPGKKSPHLEEQGPVVGWCQAIRLFAAAAIKAGHNLNRRTFVEAMAGIRNFPGTWSPVLSYGPNKFYGPTEYQVVRIHNNDPNHNACTLTFQNIPQGTCWQVVQSWRPLPPP